MLRLPLALVCLGLLLAGSAAASESLVLPAIDRDALVAADKELDPGGPLRYSDPWILSLSPADGPGWERLADGSHRWRLEVLAPGALSLGFGFDRFRLPWGGELRITGERGPDRVFTAADMQDHGQLWTPVVLGEAATVSLTLPAGHRDDFALELVSVGRGFRFFGEPPADKQGSCNVDVVCPEGDPWRHEIPSVAVYQIGNSWVCTGAMINNTARDGTPYFLTAHHCNVHEANAASVVVYWNFESPVCGDLSGGSLADTQSGAVWRASFSDSDMTLIELSALPDTSWHVTYAGWDRSGAVPASAVCIHHPSTDEKAISFEDAPLQKTAYLGTATNPAGAHWRVVDWDLGTTEPGSSGSPLFNPGHQIVGQLHGGYAACGNDESDWYGRFDISWLGGGTNDTQLAHWLDPAGSGAVTLATYDPRDPDDPEEPEDPDRLVSFATRGNPVRVGEAAVLTYELARAGHVQLTIHDLRGRRLAVLVDADQAAGVHTVLWPGVGSAAGAYFARVEALGEEHTQAFTRLR
ncbi:MAG: hypothetical protein R3D98_04185 [Candidatus Krumholzibacteriia bacterium]